MLYFYERSILYMDVKARFYHTDEEEISGKECVVLEKYAVNNIEDEYEQQGIIKESDT